MKIPLAAKASRFAEKTPSNAVPSRRKHLLRLAEVLVLAAVYFLAAKLGLALAFQAEQVTAVWPPTGVALAAVLLFGSRLWPGVALGALVANATTPGENLATACGIAVGNTLEAVLGAWLLRWLVGFRNSMERLQDVLGFVALAAVSSTMISATIGVTSLCVANVQPWAKYGSLWALWWLGDAAGAVLIAPLLLVWASRPKARLSLRRAGEAAVLIGALVLISWVVFAEGFIQGISRHALEYTVFPFVVWAALRFGQPGTTAVSFVASSIALWGTVHGYGPFALGTPHENLILLQAYMAVVTVTALLLSAAITGLKRAEEAERERAEEVEKLMELMPVAVWIARDGECRQIIGNRAGHDLLRVPVGRNLSKTAPPEEQPTGFRILHAGKEIPPEELPMQYAVTHRVEVREYEEDIVFDDGTIVHAFGSASPLFSDTGKVRGCVAAFMDVSELRRLENELRQKVEELALADRRKNEFLATLAHELRNPLAPIRNALELLKFAGDNGKAQEHARAIMQRQLAHMVRLIDDLLDVSRITRNKLQLRRERIELATVIQSALEATKQLIDESGHELTVTLMSDPVYIDADPVRLAQVFTNLLNNAAKHSQRGGHIWLVAERQGAEVVISVRDTGIGIAAEHLPRLFEMFSQITPALERSYGGLGVGLALVKGLVELHGGRVEVHSAGPGLGSAFVVRLPVSNVAVPAPRHIDTVTDPFCSGPPRRILVVDDNRDTADSLALMLRLVGHDLQTAYDGLEAMQAAASFRPEVVLLDIGLPKMNGYEVGRHIRQEPWGKNVLMIALTGWGQSEDKQRAIEIGFDYHLTKPVDPGLLLELLARPGNGNTVVQS